MSDSRLSGALRGNNTFAPPNMLARAATVALTPATRSRPATGLSPRLVFVGLALLGVLFCPRVASAHEVGISQGRYRVAGSTLHFEQVFARPELLALVGTSTGAVDEETLTPVVRRRLITKMAVVRGDGGECVSVLDSVTPTESDGMIVRGKFNCDGPTALVDVRLGFFGSLAGGHRHLVTGAGRGGAELVLFGGNETFRVGRTAVQRAESPWWSLFLLGVEHIVTGWDHLVFLVGVLIVGGRFRALAQVITSFTVGHSVSLSLALLDVWRPAASVVELLIAASVVFVAVENRSLPALAGRWPLTGVFGFVHGFGFAGALGALGVSGDRWFAPLLSFNLGVEAGQVIALLVLLPIVRVVGRHPQRDRIVRAVSLAVGLCGLAWFVLRAIPMIS